MTEEMTEQLNTLSLSSESSPHRMDKNVCYLCHGIGHWARECTSLPSGYLAENPPQCYHCSGIGHFAKSCPTALAKRALRHGILPEDLRGGQKRRSAAYERRREWIRTQRRTLSDVDQHQRPPMMPPSTSRPPPPPPPAYQAP